MRSAWTIRSLFCSVLITVQPLAAAERPEPAALAEADLRPGLLAVYRSLIDGATLERIDPVPHFALAGTSPHPRIPPGPFEVRLSGVLWVEEEPPLGDRGGSAETIRFGGYLGGELTVKVGGAVALRARGEDPAARLPAAEPLDLRPGPYRLEIEYRSLAGIPARLQLWWEGRTFSPEPLPSWRLRHPDIEEAEREASAATRDLERGRAAAGRLGCGRCHQSAFPAVDDPPPGPAFEGWGDAIDRGWLLRWLEDPAKARAGARMPALFASGAEGAAERWIVTEHLLRLRGAAKPIPPAPPGDHRPGRRHFIDLGCPACHQLPDQDRASQPDLDRFPLAGLGERLSAAGLAALVEDPRRRYPDGRMPRLPAPDGARHLAAFLLLWSKPPADGAAAERPPATDDLAAVFRRLGVEGMEAAGEALVREKRCARCHSGLPEPAAPDVPLPETAGERGCLSAGGLPRFALDAGTRRALELYRRIARRDRHPSLLDARRRLLDRQGCFRCHAAEADRPSPLEEAACTLGGSNLETVPFQRTPRLNHAHLKYTGSYLLSSIREGVKGNRHARYTYRMPAYGDAAEELVRALAAIEGDLSGDPDPPRAGPADPTLAGFGPRLAGFEGYACVSCHLWNGQQLADPDPGAIGPELATVTRRIRREWFDRWLEDPARIQPRTPMPRIFPRGEAAPVGALLDGDAARQREALWSWLALGKEAPGPAKLPPIPIAAPAAGAPSLVAQIPVHLPGGAVVEGLAILSGSHDLLLYDVGRCAPRGFYTGARLLRSARGRLRTFTLEGKLRDLGLAADPVPELVSAEGVERAESVAFQGYQRLADGARIRSRARFRGASVEVVETFRLPSGGEGRRLVVELGAERLPAGTRLVRRPRAGGEPLAAGESARFDLPPGEAPPSAAVVRLPDPGPAGGSLERPGYRAVAYPRPRTSSGEDLILPGALAVDPGDGRVFVASMKLGEIFVLRDPRDDGREARFEDYTGGLFQEAYSMHAEAGALHVLHRRNLTRITDVDGDGRADRFDRLAALPHGVADTYDYGYGLVREPGGAFVMSFAPYANTGLPGSGGAIRLTAGGEAPPEELAFGFRNPLGWCSDAAGEVFATDNQGEWVAANKLVHVVRGRYYGFPNQAQKQYVREPPARAAAWVPYDWARSVNGVTCDLTGGKFGSFAGQFFLAELMFGGAIIRVALEKVNGEYQGACFPFWGKGLLGPLVLAFDPRGRLYVGSITEPGWMAQPDRGALFRIDFTGEIPFEIHSIRVLPRGFRLIFTRPASPESARATGAYLIEHYRYEYTGAYGSPELDRTPLAVEAAEPSADGRAVDLRTGPLVKDRIYRISAPGVASPGGEKLVHPTGAYTLNEIPREER